MVELVKWLGLVILLLIQLGILFFISMGIIIFLKDVKKEIKRQLKEKEGKNEE